MIKRVLIFTLLLVTIKSAYSQTEITLENYFRTLKSVKVEIQNNTYDFLFDTGGGITIVSPDIIKELNMSAYGNKTGFRMSGDRIDMKLCDSIDLVIGRIKFHHSCVGVFDIMDLLPEGFKRIDGIISLKTFENHQITLNLDENKIIVETEVSYRKKTKNMNELQSRFANGPDGSELNILVGVKAQDRLWWFLFDSGNIAQTIISRNVSSEWRLSSERDLIDEENEITDIGNYSIYLAGDSIISPTVIDDIIYDGALSYDFIRQSEYTISFPEEKIYMGKSF